MSGIDDARDSEAKEANSKLNEGLKSCRAVLSNYRALLDKKSGGRAGEQSKERANSDKAHD